MLKLRALLLAACYDRAMRHVERRCLARWRAELLTPLRGEILEIGSGTGTNLQYYAPQVKRLVLSEPDRFMRTRLQVQARRRRASLRQVEIIPCRAEQIDLPAASFDHIVSTLVLCSVTDIERTLQELRRLLKPGGSLVFFEHVRADDNPGLYKLQKRLEPVWKWCAGNCHLTRPTGQLLEQAGFAIELERVAMQGVPAFVRPVIKGVAFRSR